MVNGLIMLQPVCCDVIDLLGNPAFMERTKGAGPFMGTKELKTRAQVDLTKEL